MDTNEKLQKYREQAEKFSGYDGDSGYDGYDGPEGESSFDYNAGGNQSYINADGAGAQEVSQPYIISIENTTSGALTATVFGWNDNTGQANFGNNVGLVFTDVIRASTFNRLFNQSMSAPFKIGKFRFSSDSAAQLRVSVIIQYVDSNGNQLNKTIPLSQTKSLFQQVQTDIDVPFPVTVDANTIINVSILGNTTLTIAMFPDNRITNKSALNNAGGSARARIPNPNSNGSAPVVIQTNSQVRAIK